MQDIGKPRPMPRKSTEEMKNVEFKLDKVKIEHDIEPGCCTVHHPEKVEVTEDIESPFPCPALDHSLYPVQMDTSMKALVKAGPEIGLRYLNVNKPACGNDDCLIKVKKAAICGTDLHIWNWDEWSQKSVPTPMTTGHEFMGVVKEIGSNVKNVKVGDRVTAEGHITCGHCRNCRAGRRHLCRNTIGLGVNRPGCFAELVSIPVSNVFPLHKAIPDDVAAFMDPLGNAVHSCLSFDLVGEDVLITGAGPIGIMSAAICRQVGARNVVVTDVNPYRLNLAKHCGATAVVDVSVQDDTLHKTMEWLGMCEGFDIGLEMSGNPQATALMLQHMNNGGRISMLGIPSGPYQIDWDQVIFKGLIIKGIYGREMFDTWYKMSNLLVSGLTERLRPAITHVVDADDFEHAFASCASASSGKVLLNWD